MNIGPAITRIVNNPKVINFASNPTWPVAGLIITNAIFRPVFTLADPNVKPSAKKYSAAREFFHQVLCLITHFAFANQFKKLGFWIGKKLLPNNAAFKQFNNYAEVTKFMKNGGNIIKKFPVVNGAIMVGSTLGAIAALAVVAPKLNNWLLPPLLNTLGIKLDKEDEYNKLPGIYAKSLKNGEIIQNFTYKELQSINYKA